MHTLDELKNHISRKLSKKFKFGKKIEIDKAGLHTGLYFIYDANDKLFYLGQAGYNGKTSSIYKRMRQYTPSNKSQNFVINIEMLYENDYREKYKTFKLFYENHVKLSWTVRVFHMPNISKENANDLEKFCIEQFTPISNIVHSKIAFNNHIARIIGFS